jgi:hypothetical protein
VIIKGIKTTATTANDFWSFRFVLLCSFYKRKFSGNTSTTRIWKLLGNFAAVLMNESHSDLTVWGLTFLYIMCTSTAEFRPHEAHSLPVLPRPAGCCCLGKWTGHLLRELLGWWAQRAWHGRACVTCGGEEKRLLGMVGKPETRSIWKT